MKLLLLVPVLILAACSNLTPAQKYAINSRVVTAAASRGVSPADSKTVLNLIENSAVKQP